VFYDKLFSFQDTTQTPYEIQSSFKLGLGIHSTCAWQGLEAIKWIIAVPTAKRPGRFFEIYFYLIM
jgi:hypothetical protein